MPNLMLCSISVCRDGQVTCDNSSCVSTCQWSAWSLWSPCGVTCGLGLQQRYRSVILNIFDSQIINCTVLFCLNFVSSLFQSACFYCDLLFDRCFHLSSVNIIIIGFTTGLLWTQLSGTSPVQETLLKHATASNPAPLVNDSKPRL